MNFQDIPLEISYKSVGEEAFCNILNPLLSCAKTYKRSVGFFSSSALTFIGKGIVDMAKKGGKVYLATSPKLSDEDTAAIKKGYSEREILKKNFLTELEESLIDVSDENAELLYMLIRDGIIDIKIVRKKSGMYHDKLAVLEDYDGNIVVCSGSGNESGNGYNNNYEKVRVYKSWNDTEGRIQDETEEFESIWNKSNDFLEVYDFMQAVEEKIIERVKHEGPFKKKTTKYKMRSYQNEAKNNWVTNGHKGFFIMATGTGKTITALNSFTELINENKVFTVIAVPYIHLVNQWYEDAKEFFPDAEIIMVHGGYPNADQDIHTAYYAAKKEYKPIIVITTISSFYIDRYQNLYSKIAFDKLLIVDEAHNFLNKINDDLSSQFKYKLGLSATPVFGNNEEKTRQLLDWFGGKVIDYPIEKAIGKHLVNYEYHPIFVYATEEDEKKFNKATSLMLQSYDEKTGKIIDEQKFTIAYRARLRAISMANEKMSKIDSIFSKIEDKDHTIIYCSDGRMYKGVYSDKKAQTEEVRHLEYILGLINNSLLSTNSNAKASKFTASEDIDTRIRLIEDFNSGYLNYLVAIKCLDEGINIPSIRSALILSSNDNYREFVQRRGRILRQYDDGTSKKEKAHIYDVVVLPSNDCIGMAKIELKRFLEYARLSLNWETLSNKLDSLLMDYDLTINDIKYENEYIIGGDLDE
ncbi:MAG: DEAD/DEAH box helicase family protein [Eubacterium coprostanoligenes]|nr:DEAD/DEAH box helicase family protein [Eubacterium coprostanoligenes]